MKKKGIIISLIGILLLSIFIFVILNNKQKYIMQDGIMLALTLDGTSISEFPEGTNYRVEIDCANAKGMWLTEEWKLSVSDISGDVTCNLDFYTKTENDSLINIVESSTENIPAKKYTTTYDENDKLNLDDYIDLSNDETNPFVFNSSTNVWETNTTEYNIMSFKLNSGFYQICFKAYDPDDYMANFEISDESYTNYYTFSTDSTMTDYNCEVMSEITEPTIFNVSYSGSSSVSNVSFYIQNVTEVVTFEVVSDAGYRYIGKTPNNYIWFNNEMWRIIGSVPTKLLDETTTNLIKIIRNDSIGGLIYNTASTGEWGNNTLYTLLNEYYYGKNDGNETDFCYAGIYSSYSYKTDCNYASSGISNEENNYYGKMIEEVYWNTGTVSSTGMQVGEIYEKEKENQTISGNIGLINLSDFGFGTIDKYYKESIYTYSGIESSNNWLADKPMMWTITSYNETSAISLINSGSISNSSKAENGYAVRPVVYLDPSVYVVSGDGSITNPYQIAME